jgi:hypothetical protein
MSMGDMRNRVDRERQQHSREDNSQPLRWSSGQMYQAHERQRMTSSEWHSLRRTIATVKYGELLSADVTLSSVVCDMVAAPTGRRHVPPFVLNQGTAMRVWGQVLQGGASREHPE